MLFVLVDGWYINRLTLLRVLLGALGILKALGLLGRHAIEITLMISGATLACRFSHQSDC